MGLCGGWGYRMLQGHGEIIETTQQTSYSLNFVAYLGVMEKNEFLGDIHDWGNYNMSLARAVFFFSHDR